MSTVRGQAQGADLSPARLGGMAPPFCRHCSLITFAGVSFLGLTELGELGATVVLQSPLLW